jgi:O-succinylbenzoic acid--CoA ligase
MHVPAWLPRAAAVAPEHPALEVPGASLTYAQLDAAAAGGAAALGARGIERGDRVALLLEAGEAFAVALHACLRLGAVAMPVDLRLGEEERAAQTSTAALVLREPLDSAAGERVAPPGTHDLEAAALVVHTSGTSGAATPVELTYGNLLWSAMGSTVALGLDAHERWLCPLPLTHVGGLSILVRSAIAATTAVLHPRFDAERVIASLGGERITVVSLVPTMVGRLLDAGLRRAPDLRWALVGGAGLEPKRARRARDVGLPVAETYGLTQAASQVATSGVALFCTQVAIAADREILVAGPTVAPGAVSPDGWLHTGDQGALDEHGRLSVTGRAADTIVSGGENVAPTEVEAALLEHPAVAEAAVHGRPDPEWGEAIVATVVLRDGTQPTEEELRAHVAGRLARFKVPKAVRVAGALPRTASGKLRRGELR